jgi:hypothetical protein
MLRREIDRLEGLGTIVKADGSEIGPRPYSNRVCQRAPKGDDGESIPEMSVVDGRLEVEDYEAVNFLLDRAELTLRLEDGRTFPFFFSNGDGTITPKGSLR